MIRFNCQNCNGEVSCIEAMAGLTLQCKKCFNWVHVPAQTVEPSTAKSDGITLSKPLPSPTKSAKPSSAFSANPPAGSRPSTGDDDLVVPDISKGRGYGYERSVAELTGLTVDQFEREIAHGARFVVYSYCISLIAVTFKQSSAIYFVRGFGSRVARGLTFSFVSLVLGWWGIPFGIIFTISSFISNSAGGTDVTAEILNYLAGFRSGDFDHAKPTRENFILPNLQG